MLLLVVALVSFVVDFFATELIRLSSVNDDDKDCINQWVLRVLLPTTRRMLDPELGSYPQAWSFWRPG